MTAERFFHNRLNGIGELDIVCKELMVEYARLKCQELLLLVAEKAEENFTYSFGYSFEDKDSILNVVDLEKFCGGTPSS